MYIIYSFEISTVVNREIVWASIRPDCWRDWDTTIRKTGRASESGCRIFRDASTELVFNVTTKKTESTWALTYDACTEGSRDVRHERFEIHTGADDKSTVLFISMSSVPGWCCFLPRGMAVARRSLRKLHVALQSYLSD